MEKNQSAVERALAEEGRVAQESLDRQLLALAVPGPFKLRDAAEKGAELLGRGARPSGALDAAGRDALMGALLHGMQDLALCLLEAGARVDLRDEHGHNALSMAAFDSNTRAMEMILERIPASEMSGIGPLGLDAWVLVAARCPKAKKLAELAPRHPEQCDLNEALMMAVGAKDREASLAATALLLGMGANPNARRQGKMAYGAMQEALLFCNEGAAEALLASGADPLAAHANGDTALSIAARMGLEKSLRMLAHVSRLDSRDNQGYTPLMEALENQQSQRDQGALPFLLSISDLSMPAFQEDGLNPRNLTMRGFAEKYGTPESLRLLDQEVARREACEIAMASPRAGRAEQAKRI